jgi:hypothetical protein
MSHKKYLWCDIDSTLTEEDLMPRLGPLSAWGWRLMARLHLRERIIARPKPDPVAFKYLEMMGDAGFFITLVTARDTALRQGTVDWLDKWSARYDGLYTTNDVWMPPEELGDWKASVIEEDMVRWSLGPPSILVFVDDNPHTCRMVDQRLGKKGLITINTNVWTCMDGLVRHLTRFQ